MVKDSIDYVARALLGAVFVVLILVWGYSILITINFDSRLKALEGSVGLSATPASLDVESLLLSNGWVKDCWESINVSKYVFVDERVNVSECRWNFYSHSGVLDCSNASIIPARVVYYNDSVCVKYVLVKGGLSG